MKTGFNKKWKSFDRLLVSGNGRSWRISNESKKITGVVEISLFYQIVDQAFIAV